jgi:RNA polymerase sigma-70 factor (ECF subfamily)
MAATGPEADAVLADAVRHEAGPVVAALHRLTGDFDVAEEAVQDALVSAVAAWRRDGPPPNPGAWLTLTARRKAVDRLRREGARGRLAAAVAAQRIKAAGPPEAGSWSDTDERVAMLFGCCHPALAVEVRLALTLRSVAGLTTDQVARTFLVPEATLAQRIVRAKRKIVATGIRMEVPETRMPERLDDVLTVVYLTYNAGFVDAASRGLAEDAVWLAEVLTTGLPREPEAWGLLALLTLQQSRAAARFGPNGELVLLADQDRTRWDHPAIARADRYLERAAVWRRPGRFQLQAAIAACHASAPTYGETDWLQILTLYDLLLRHDRSPVVRLNRAVALAECVGPGPALEEVDALATELDAYHLWHATRADLLRRLGRHDAATDANRRALDLAAIPAERALLRERLTA